jgi:ABC-type sugar transport system ATPase subunit
MASLELVRLTKHWPAASICVDLTADTGKILAIAGPSGCGKSTVLRMAAGLERADSGSVSVDGRDVTDSEPSERGIGMVFQDHALFPHLDVSGNIEYGLRVRHVNRDGRRARIEQLLETLDLAGFEHRKPHELSGGESQRVALARALAVDPLIILFDEPLSSIDAALRKRLRSEIANEQRRLGFTAVYVTHDLEEAMALGDTLAIMDAGAVLQCAPPERLWENPASVAVARFMGSGPVLAVKGIESIDGKKAARTATGIFPLDAGAVEAFETISSHGDPAYVYFERSSVRIATGSTQAYRFSALCQRTDFAGDTIDCAMDVGGESCTFRMDRNGAPKAGMMADYYIPDATLRIIPGTRIR